MSTLDRLSLTSPLQHERDPHARYCGYDNAIEGTVISGFVDMASFVLEPDVKARSARQRGGAKSASLLHGLGGRFGLIGVCVYLSASG